MKAGVRHELLTFFSNQNYDITGLLVSMAERHSELPFTSKSGVPTVIADPDNRP